MCFMIGTCTVPSRRTASDGYLRGGERSDRTTPCRSTQWRATRPCGSSYNRCQPDTGVIARPPTASGRRQAAGASRRASVARGAAAAATRRLPRHPSQQHGSSRRGRRPRRRFVKGRPRRRSRRAAERRERREHVLGRLRGAGGAARQPERVPHARGRGLLGQGEPVEEHAGREERARRHAS